MSWEDQETLGSATVKIGNLRARSGNARSSQENFMDAVRSLDTKAFFSKAQY